MSLKKLFLIVSSLMILALNSGCSSLLDLAVGAAISKAAESDAYTLSDTHLFTGELRNRHYRDLLIEVGEEMAFELESEDTNSLLWALRKSNFLEEYAIGKYEGAYISVVVGPAMDDNYQLIPGKKMLTLTISAEATYKDTSREEVKAMFQDITGRFEQKCLASR